MDSFCKVVARWHGKGIGGVMISPKGDITGYNTWSKENMIAAEFKPKKSLSEGLMRHHTT